MSQSVGPRTRSRTYIDKCTVHIHTMASSLFVQRFISGWFCCITLSRAKVDWQREAQNYRPCETNNMQFFYTQFGCVCVSFSSFDCWRNTHIFLGIANICCCCCGVSYFYWKSTAFYLCQVTKRVSVCVCPCEWNCLLMPWCHGVWLRY